MVQVETLEGLYKLNSVCMKSLNYFESSEFDHLSMK